ncbi:MAG TPA: AAA domain-containing protein [Candidatus Methanomethylophilaceae archaeon]|nr:AAA domain-containing protein [Candidatus Methanomethylophilaceae archaeon]
MMGSDELYSMLYSLREKLRREEADEDGNKPVICSDRALTEMSLEMPLRPEQLESIVEIDEKFIDIYGSVFLEVIQGYHSKNENGARMDDRTAEILRELEKKLVNINKRNRMLYQGRLSKNLTFDLSDIIGKDFSDILFGNRNNVRLCDLATGEKQIKIYKILNDMLREVNRSSRETGQYDLFIAYPFVQGKMPGGDFEIRAPLALFPVKMEKDSRYVNLIIDRSRDPIFNGTLALAYIKLAGENRPMPDLTIENYNADNFFKKLIDFYSKQGISMETCNMEPVEFKEYRAGEFPKYLPGQLKIVPNFVLGRYSSYSSSIHLDFERIIEGNDINRVLDNLIKDLDPSYFLEYSKDSPSENDNEKKKTQVLEKDLLYINPLNSAQENVLTGIQKNDALVVQGPPGTGKSQVITALIVSEIMHGRNVLMISEKKTALDVVYSRLGTLSKYCLLVDDAGDKEEFYSQIRRMLEPTTPRYGANLDQISESIDRNIDILDHIGERMYTPDKFGISPYKLYSMDRWLDLSDKHQYEEYKKLREGVDPLILTLTYPEVKNLHKTFSDPVTLLGFREYSECLERTPWIKDMKPHLSEYNISEIKILVLALEEKVSEWMSKNAISRSMGKKKIVKQAEDILNIGFDTYGDTIADMLIADPKRFIDALADYNIFSERNTSYKRMADSEKIYGENLITLTASMNYNAQQCNDQILKYILNEHLQRFDAENKDLMQRIQDFDRIVTDVDNKITEKMKLSKNSVEQCFQESLRNIAESKRRGDITRIAESKNKWKINKFVERFDYELFGGIRVWLITPDALSEILPLRMGLFDLVIFDEASQMYVERGIPAIYRAKKVVIAGDHKQLRPSSLGFGRLEYEEGDMEDEAALEEESLLDLARARYDSVMLNFHYRSKYEELIAFSNYAFYGGRLYVSPNIKAPEKPPIEMHRVNGIWDNTRNKVEAAKIIDLLREFFMTRKNNETVGILTFNASQRDLITDMLDDECIKDPTFGRIFNDELVRFDNGEDVGLFIKNIETVQGDERDVIMFSIGYAPNPDGKMTQRFGWLNNRGGENRLNVAVSRAKRKVHVVASIDPEDLRVEDTVNEGPRIFKKYLQYARAISDENQYVADSILQSFNEDKWKDIPIIETESSIADRVYNSLIRKGYTVDRNVGIGGYHIDLAVKQNGNYILGIESDGHLYGMSQSTRERDYHRQKYLEINGWNMHRVWTPGMWKDSEREISKIVKAIESRN